MSIPPNLSRLAWLTYSCGILALGLGLAPRLKLPLIGEAVLFFAGLLFFFHSKKLNAFILPLGHSQRHALFIFIGLILVGQLASNSNATYPFPQWHMYCYPKPSTEYIEYHADYASGRSGFFPFERISPTGSSGRPFVGRFNNILFPKGASRDSVSLATRADFLIMELRPILQYHNFRHPEDPIRRLSIFRKTVPIDAYDGEHSILSSLLLQVEP
jgi:hypothetical protein